MSNDNTTPKRLSREELDEALALLHAGYEEYAATIKRHIDALEAELDAMNGDLDAMIGAARKERAENERLRTALEDMRPYFEAVFDHGYAVGREYRRAGATGASAIDMVAAAQKDASVSAILTRLKEATSND